MFSWSSFLLSYPENTESQHETKMDTILEEMKHGQCFQNQHHVVACGAHAERSIPLLSQT